MIAASEVKGSPISGCGPGHGEKPRCLPSAIAIRELGVFQTHGSKDGAFQVGEIKYQV